MSCLTSASGNATNDVNHLNSWLSETDDGSESDSGEDGQTTTSPPSTVAQQEVPLLLTCATEAAKLTLAEIRRRKTQLRERYMRIVKGWVKRGGGREGAEEGQPGENELDAVREAFRLLLQVEEARRRGSRRGQKRLADDTHALLSGSETPPASATKPKRHVGGKEAVVVGWQAPPPVHQNQQQRGGRSVVLDLSQWDEY